MDASEVSTYEIVFQFLISVSPLSPYYLLKCGRSSSIMPKLFRGPTELRHDGQLLVLYHLTIATLFVDFTKIQD